MPRRALILLSLLLAPLWACSDDVEPVDDGRADGAVDRGAPDASPPPDCPRGEAWVAGASRCEPFVATELVNEAVTFANGAQQLSGTVTFAGTDLIGRFPAVVLIHGSGPNDRDGSATGALGFAYGKEVRTLEDVAEHLARHGFLVLRYDKRTCIAANNPHCTATTIEGLETITVDTFTADASAGLDYLKTRGDVRADDLVVVGHSQGGPLAIDLALARDDVRNVIVLAGPASALVDLLVAQYEQVIAWLLDEPPSPERDAQLAAAEEERDLYAAALPAIADGSYEEPTFKGSPVGFWKSWIDGQERIEDNLEQLEQPLAVVSGTLDYNVPPSETEQLEAWRGERSGDLFTVYPDLTHSLIKITGGMLVGDHVHQQLLDDLTTWLVTPSD